MKYMVVGIFTDIIIITKQVLSCNMSGFNKRFLNQSFYMHGVNSVLPSVKCEDFLL